MGKSLECKVTGDRGPGEAPPAGVRLTAGLGLMARLQQLAKLLNS